MSAADTRRSKRAQRRAEALPKVAARVAMRPEPIVLELPKVNSVTARAGRQRLVALVAITLVVFGIVMVASASSGELLLQGMNQWALLVRQSLFGVIGLCSMWAAARVPLEFVRRMAKPLVWISVGLVAVTMVPGLGTSANGATRWINLGFFQLQPSEPLKLGVLILLADHLSRNQPPLHWMRDLVRSPGGVALGLAGAIVALQSDLGSGLVIGATTLVLYMLAGTKWSVLWRTIGPGVALVVLSILTEPYRRERFLAFLDPWAHPQAGGYQLVQALIAIGSGGPFGVGLGHSVQKITFLPEAHTDMIFAIIVEELGVFGVALVVGAFAVLAAVGARIAMRAKTRFSALLAAGVTAMVVGQAIINVAGVTGGMPLTGIPLPLVSYGGSSLLITLTALGLLANIATERRPARSFPLAPPPSLETPFSAHDRDEPSNDYLIDDDATPEYHGADAAPGARAGGGRRNGRSPRARTRGR
ncbi:MAG: cell division-specific peptidoglycan biosynthesis regulator FtsW [Thermoleophilia bacterium]|nr:cell division-specific peptidoglycan biosynthesis regulator FtsW [Thermoleophilia bacterium]